MRCLPTCCVMTTQRNRKIQKILFVHGVCPYDSEDFVPNLNIALDTNNNSFRYSETEELSKWGDWARSGNTLIKGHQTKRNIGGIISYKMGKKWMKINGFIQCVTGHQDEVGYACFVPPKNEKEKYEVPWHNNVYNAWVLSSTFDGEIDVTNVTKNRIHTLSTAVYSKFHSKYLCNHFFMTISNNPNLSPNFLKNGTS